MKEAVDTEFRVVRLSAPLRDDFRRKRAASGQTNAAFIAEAVALQLPQVVEALRKLGFAGADNPSHPSRLPFSAKAGTLQALKAASRDTGVPAVRLLASCLLAATQGGPRKRTRPAGAKVSRKLVASEVAP